MPLSTERTYFMCYWPGECGAVPLRDGRTGRLMLFTSAVFADAWKSRTRVPVQVVPVSGRRVLDSGEEVLVDWTAA